jgi:hypothetical protein
LIDILWLEDGDIEDNCVEKKPGRLRLKRKSEAVTNKKEEEKGINEYK